MEKCQRMMWRLVEREREKARERERDDITTSFGRVEVDDLT